jgi:hypothetical protein
MEEQTDRDYFTFRHGHRTLGGLAQKKRTGGLIKIFAELIYKTKNITNFRVVNHLFFMFKYLNVRYINIT